MKEHIETKECVNACGVDRNSIGISSDSLFEPRLAAKLCSPACYQHCANIVDLYFNLAAEEGVYLPDLCNQNRNNPHRAMIELSSNGAASEDSVIASIVCDPNVWNAVMQNPALQEFLDSKKTSASFPDSDYKIDESVVDADFFSQSSQRSASSKSEAEESKFGNTFTNFLQNVTRTVTQIVVDIIKNLSDFFNKLFGGNKVFFNADGSAKLGDVRRHWEHLSWAWQSWL
ncbi:hypothetical protein CQW23_23921 [Capsicum baccatum]|uniref:Uncharacterized protein n=1 Tax=Capsicum baccatum TaxID=33114 RepID=A0A2G2VTC3_CAPBA|nr:hypothetical protein CQW23_23921 [Capsicum baccatum]